MTDPNSPDWLDGYLTAESEYESGHGHKDDIIRGLREALEHKSNYHWGPSGQICKCETCEMKREVLSLLDQQEESDGD